MGYAPPRQGREGAVKRPSFDLGKYEAKAIKGPRADARFYWQARLFIGGERRYQTSALGWLSEAEAFTELSKRLGEGSMAPAPRRAAPSRRTVADLLALYMGARLKAADLSPDTKRNNQTACNRVTDAIGTVVIEQVTLEVLEGYRDQALRRGASSTVRFDLRVMRQAWTWGTTRGLLVASWPKVRVLDRGDARPKLVAELDDVEAIEQALRARWPDGWPWRCFHLLAVTGARISEIAKLEVGAVDLARAELRIRGKHTPGKPPVRIFPLLSDTVAMLEEWIKGSPSKAPLWGPSPMSVANSLRGDHIPKAELVAQVGHITPYALRRAAVRAFLRRRVPIKVAAELLGHTPERMLRDYELATESDLRDAVELARPGRRAAGKVIKLVGREE